MSAADRERLARLASLVFDNLPDWPQITLTLSPKDAALLVAMADIGLATLPDDAGVALLTDVLDQITHQSGDLGALLRGVRRSPHVGHAPQ